MTSRNKNIYLTGCGGIITIKRNIHGVPEIEAQNLDDLAYGLGWIHARDRQMQVLLTRILLKGQAAEHIKNEPELIELDKFIRRMNFLPDPENEIKKLEPDVKKQLSSYISGFNFYLQTHKPVIEFRLLSYNPEPWDIYDCLLIIKAFGFLGLADAQANMEKFLIQMIQNDLDGAKLRELFPYLSEPIDYDLIKCIKLQFPLIQAGSKCLGNLPKFSGSNAWAVAGELSESGKPLLCGDPHLEVNRLPSIWYEVLMKTPDNVLMGVTIPGVPGIILGRTKHIAWSAAYSCMDMFDYRIEQCKDNCYKRKDVWKPFKIREETIKVKNANPLSIRIFENDLGVLEGNPEEKGFYLLASWSARNNCGASEFNSILRMPNANNVQEAMDLFKILDASSYNFVIADSTGNIGCQMSGRQPNRPPNLSGLLPIPAWNDTRDNTGNVEKDKLPNIINPPDGVIVAANQDTNHLGESKPINLPMGSYRATRIKNLLTDCGKLNVERMKKIQLDLYSTQAEIFMSIIRPLLPDTKNGNLLRDWNCKYDRNSRGATLFESVYKSLIIAVFGDNGFGRDIMNQILNETGLFNYYHSHFDRILLAENSTWFKGENRATIYKRAISEGLKIKARRYGTTQKTKFFHLLFGGRLPGFMGFDQGPIELPGSRATINQGQIFKNYNRITTFAPSYRFVTDLASSEIHSNIPGGASDRRLSKWYKIEIKNWNKGKYKILAWQNIS